MTTSPDLAHVRRPAGPPGTNLKGPPTAAGWVYALPRLGLERAVVVGPSSPDETAQLASVADEVVVVDDVTDVERGDLVVADHHGTTSDVMAKLGSDGIAVSRPAPTRWPRWRRRPASPAAPTGASVLRAAPHARRPLLVEPWSADTGGGGEAVTMWGPGLEPESREGPPRHLRDLAARHGLDLAGWSWSMSIPAHYPSKKVVIFLVPPGSSQASLVAKMTRSEEFNHRLTNEARALRALTELHLVDGGAPRLIFDGTTGGRSVVVETAVAGRPLREAMADRPDCPVMTQGLDWLCELTRARPTPVSSTAAGDALGAMVARFVDTFRPPDPVEPVLQAAVAEVAGSDTPFPLVVQHGDPGPWNGLIQADGSLAFLDWEAATLEGIPLWDVFYFARSHAVWTHGGRGRRARTRAVEDLLEPSALGALVADRADRLADDIGLAHQLIGPLFVLCWTHRALKEAARLRPSELDRSTFAALVERCARRPEAPRLLLGGASVGRSGSGPAGG